MSVPYETLFNISPVPILVFHRETLKFLAVNQAALELYGYSTEEFLAMDCTQIRPHEDVPKFIAAFDEDRNGPVKIPRVSRHTRKDGTIIDVGVFVCPFEFQGVPVQFCYIKDISEQTRAEQLAKTLLERYRRVVSSNMVGITCWDITGKILEANSAFLDIIGYTPQDVENKHVSWLELTAPEYLQNEIQILAELDAHGVCTPFEKEYIRKDGTRVPVLIGAAFLDNSRETGVSFVLDMTKHKKVEHELKRAVQARDEFLSIAAHELRTPMTAQQTLIELTLRQLRKSTRTPIADFTKMVESADFQAKRTLKLVNTLLDVTRIRSDGLQLSPSLVNLGRLVQEIVEEMRPQLTEAQCGLELDLDSDVMGNWDVLRLGQVITNLLSNACKYASRAPLKLGVKRLNGRAILAVQDGGPGIPLEFRERIFDRFERGASRPGTPGFGLGLYISKQIIQAHGGSIWVENPSGGGSTFSIDLPIA